MSKYSANTSVLEISMMHEENDRVHFHTEFNFLKAQNGWRPGCLHVVMAGAGAGKSSLVRSLIWDLLYMGRKVALFVSEETRANVISEMGRVHKQLQSRGINIEKYFETLKIFSEQEMPRGKNANSVLQDFFKFIDEEEPEIVFFDNITTSISYVDRKTDVQFSVIDSIKNMAQVKNIPVVLVAHTGAGAMRGTSQLIDMNEIRGSKSPVMLAEFFYVLQTFNVAEKKIAFLMTLKHRGQDVMDTIHRLHFSREYRCYTRDEKFAFGELKELFKTRDRL